MRTQLFVTLPVVFSAWQAILAVILGIMWVMRRHEPAYGVLAAAMAIGFLQAFLQTPMGETPLSRLSVVLISSAPLESALVLTFALLLLRVAMAALVAGVLRARPRARAERPDRQPADLARDCFRFSACRWSA